MPRQVPPPPSLGYTGTHSPTEAEEEPARRQPREHEARGAGCQAARRGQGRRLAPGSPGSSPATSSDSASRPGNAVLCSWHMEPECQGGGALTGQDGTVTCRVFEP
mmetsp:Transcript_32335/g.100850  ORF Transcript_32335/g.100850 Transcript_32335/m.100850 type:complete len:106 (+) Transcript_32335:193-510(+)